MSEVPTPDGGVDSSSVAPSSVALGVCFARPHREVSMLCPTSTV